MCSSVIHGRINIGIRSNKPEYAQVYTWSEQLNWKLNCGYIIVS